MFAAIWRYETHEFKIDHPPLCIDSDRFFVIRHNRSRGGNQSDEFRRVQSRVP
jgi:hypothetical protein